jgi:hypothetical protein
MKLKTNVDYMAETCHEHCRHSIVGCKQDKMNKLITLSKLEQVDLK